MTERVRDAYFKIVEMIQDNKPRTFEDDIRITQAAKVLRKDGRRNPKQEGRINKIKKLPTIGKGGF